MTKRCVGETDLNLSPSRGDFIMAARRSKITNTEMIVGSGSLLNGLVSNHVLMDGPRFDNGL